MCTQNVISFVYDNRDQFENSDTQEIQSYIINTYNFTKMSWPRLIVISLIWQLAEVCLHTGNIPTKSSCRSYYTRIYSVCSKEIEFKSTFCILFCLYNSQKINKYCKNVNIKQF